ncbi:uncharacterized protein LOC135981218 [Chrysemys picta bellii]|uniref:uncharacterized protein LOC135981218 n=1 Tax=Chrysemys picta bellii TaxID=8478 RepID=UPI0032B2DC6C
MAEQRAYEGLGKKALENLCSEKRISFRKKATNQELRNLLIASDQGARAQPLPEAAEEAEKIRMQRVTSQLQFEHEQKLADLRLLEKQKIAELESEREKEADEREERARKGRLELLAAEQETHKMEQETARLQLQVLEERRKSSPPGTPLPPRHEKNWERMCPIYNDTEDIEEFLSTFERLCNLYQIPEGQRMPVLLTRLTGKAREVFNDLGEQEALDYGQFKDSVLRRFKVTPESYRVKFREFKMPKDCTFVECAHKLMGFVKKWVVGAKAHGSFEKLLDLITLEQFLDIVPDHVRAAVCDRDPESVLRAAEIADAHTQNRAREGCKTPGKTNHHSPQFKRREGFKSKSVPDSSRGVQGGPEGRNSYPRTEQITCYHCGMLGHMRPDCPTLKGSPKPATPNATINANSITLSTQAEPSHNSSTLSSGASTAVANVNPIVSSGMGGGDKLTSYVRTEAWQGSERFIMEAKVNDVECTGWRDTGSDVTIVKGHLVKPEDMLPGEYVTVVALSEYSVNLPMARIHLEWDGFKGDVKAAVRDLIPADVLVGNNILGVPGQVNVVTRSQKEFGAVADTRTDGSEGGSKQTESASQDGSGEGLSEISEMILNPNKTQSEFIVAQQSDVSLERARNDAQSQVPACEERGRFFMQDGLLYREPPRGRKNSQATARKQLVVPESYRNDLLKLAHDSPFAGHLGVGKTCDRLEQNFYWPHLFGSVRDYCRSCELCQKRKGLRGPSKVPLQPLPIIGEAFARVAVDIVGPLPKPSRNGKKYILVLVDFATRYPEAVALANIEAETVAVALFSIFSRVGFPKEILSDRGSNFMSVVFKQLWELCGVKHLKAAPYHPQTNGLVERFNGTLKSMLKMYVDRRQNDWDVMLPYLLYAYRSVPQESTGFAPFELLYGRQVRGPLDLVRDSWEGNVEEAEQPVAEYVAQFKESLQEMMKLVEQNLKESQDTQKAWYDRDAKERAFEIGDMVLVLDPVRKNKMKDVWSGPMEVVERINEVTYDVRKPQVQGSVQTVHVNRMKAYHAREVNVNTICYAEEEAGSAPLIDMVAESQEETPLESIEMGEDLTPPQRKELLRLLKHHKQTFSNRPGLTDRMTHSIQTVGPRPAPSRAYRAKGEMQRQIQEEVESMLTMGIITRSQSPWASPIVMVPKKDKTMRFCVDYRKLNAITQPDPYPTPRIEDLLDTLGGARFISTLDLTKGYWQIPLDAEAQGKSAFIVESGLYEFKVLPFGMRNSGATFMRLINEVLRGLESFARAYIDDLAVFSSSWQDHLNHIGIVLHRLREANLTVKVSKCRMGAAEVTYLGHRVGNGQLRPEPVKVEAIKNWPTPRTKKQVQSFIGLANYYRRFVQGFSDIVAPITDLTKKEKPDRVLWTEACEQGFQSIKSALAKEPVLASPDFEKPFLLCTDASNIGLGAVLMQEGEGGKRHPVAYLSKKLSPTEQNYATIEKECYAIVWAVKQLKPYLYNKKFTVLSDHAPLVWLHRAKGNNSRLLRWSLALQEYEMDIVHIRGKENIVADALSRVESS